jgi:hypothetical protein
MINDAETHFFIMKCERIMRISTEKLVLFILQEVIFELPNAVDAFQLPIVDRLPNDVCSNILEVTLHEIFMYLLGHKLL